MPWTIDDGDATKTPRKLPKSWDYFVTKYEGDYFTSSSGARLTHIVEESDDERPTTTYYDEWRVTDRTLID